MTERKRNQDEDEDTRSRGSSTYKSDEE